MERYINSGQSEEVSKTIEENSSILPESENIMTDDIC